jgi:hypothetical protein
MHIETSSDAGAHIDIPGIEADADTRGDVEAQARRAIVRALNRHPYDVWTSGSLARAVGASPTVTGKILVQLASAGMVHRLEDDEDGYTVAGDRDD